MMVLIVNTPFVMEFPTDNPLFVLLMEIALHQILVHVPLGTMETIVNIQYVLEFFPMKPTVVPTLLEVLVCHQIIVHVPLDTLDHNVKIIFVLVQIQVNLKFALLMEIVLLQINANVKFITMVSTVNIQISMNLLLPCAALIAPST
jgi:hypothetical protein